MIYKIINQKIMTKKLSILIILLLSSFQLAMADAVSVAAKQLEDNYNNVVKSLQDRPSRSCDIPW